MSNILALYCRGLFVCLMVFNATFNNISVISWRSVLLVDETGGPRENHRPIIIHWQTLSNNVVHLTLIKIFSHLQKASSFLQVLGFLTPANFRPHQYYWNIIENDKKNIRLFIPLYLCFMSPSLRVCGIKFYPCPYMRLCVPHLVSAK